MREALVTIGDAEFEDLGIDELVSLYQAAGIQEFEELACHGDSSIIQVEVDRPVDEDRLDAIEYVEEWERVTTSTDSHLYVIAFYAPELSDEITNHVAELMGTCEPEVTDDGVTMSLVGSQEAIAGTIDEYEREGVSPDLRKLGEYQGRQQPLDRLTDRQREVIQTAFEMGYYEVPRSVSTEDIAAELDVDSSTVAEHLQRAERNLLSHHLSSG
ncbi:MAG: helix-turn-helix domain-containing protein [Halobacteriales archaeon]